MVRPNAFQNLAARRRGQESQHGVDELADQEPAAVDREVHGAACASVPLIGLVDRINRDDRELAMSLPGYREFARRRPRLGLFLW